MHAHNLGTVIAFEVRRTLAKPQFWLATFAVPALLVFMFSLMLVTSTAAADAGEAQLAKPVTFTYTDASGVVRPEVAARFGGRPSTDPDADRAAVRAGSADAFVAFPADPRSQSIMIDGRDLGLTESGRYERAAVDTLVTSAKESLGNPTLVTLATGGAQATTTTWLDGRVTPGAGGVIAPALFVALLYLAVLMLGNQMLNITVEEKENRVTEMILTTIEPALLIIGKVLALVLVGLVQMVVFTVPLLVLQGLVGRGSPAGVAAPSFNGATVVLEPVPLLVGGLLFLGGFVMFTGLLVAIGSVMPTAKDASAAFSVVVIAMFLPLYSLMLIVTDPHSVVSQVLTWFPLTTPVTALVRNATGSLGPAETVGVLVLLYGFAALFLGLGVRLFRAGSISYDMRLDIRKALGLGRRSR